MEAVGIAPVKVSIWSIHNTRSAEEETKEPLIVYTAWISELDARRASIVRAADVEPTKSRRDNLRTPSTARNASSDSSSIPPVEHSGSSISNRLRNITESRRSMVALRRTDTAIAMSKSSRNHCAIVLRVREVRRSRKRVYPNRVSLRIPDRKNRMRETSRDERSTCRTAEDHRTAPKSTANLSSESPGAARRVRWAARRVKADDARSHTPTRKSGKVARSTRRGTNNPLVRYNARANTHGANRARHENNTTSREDAVHAIVA